MRSHVTAYVFEKDFSFFVLLNEGDETQESRVTASDLMSLFSAQFQIGYAQQEKKCKWIGFISLWIVKRI